MCLRLPLTRAARQIPSKIPRSSLCIPMSQTAHHVRPQTSSSTTLKNTSRSCRAAFSTSSHRAAGIMPESEEPPPKATEHLPSRPAEPTPLTDEAYHGQADTYLENLMARIEELQEKREDIDCEFTVRVVVLHSSTFLLCTRSRC